MLACLSQIVPSVTENNNLIHRFALLTLALFVQMYDFTTSVKAKSFILS